MKHYIFIILSFHFLLGCFPGGAFFEQAKIDADTTQIVGVQVVGEKSIAQVFPGANVTQSIEVPEGSPLEGTSLSIPPGALNISMSITIEEAVTPATDASLNSFGIVDADTSSIATVFSNDAGINSFAEGTAGTIQVSTSSGTASLYLTNSREYRVMFSRHDKNDGSCVDSIYQLEDSNFIRLESGIEVAQFKTPFFGTYQVISVPSIEFKTEPTLTAWGTTLLAELVPDECKVVTKVEKEALDSKNPINLGAIAVELDGQTLHVSAPNISEAPKSCILSLVDGEQNQGKSIEAQAAKVSINLESKGFPLYASSKFQCTFNDGRFLEADVDNLPAGIRVFADSTTRQVTLMTDIEQDDSYCEFKSYGFADSSIVDSGMVPNPKLHVIDFSNKFGSQDYMVRLECQLANNEMIKTPYARFSLGECSTCAPDTTPPDITDINWPSTVSSPGTAIISVNAQDDQSDLDKLCFSMALTFETLIPVRCFPLQQISGDLHQSEISIPDFYNPATYHIDAIHIYDTAGNSISLRGHIGIHQYYDKFSQADHPYYGNYEGTTTIPMISWSITAGSGNSPDTSPPSLLSFSGLNGTINVPATITINFEATDSGGSYTPGNGDTLPLCFEVASLTNYMMIPYCIDAAFSGGNSFDGIWHLDSSFGDGPWYVQRISLYDLAGNKSQYTAASPFISGGSFQEVAIEVPEFTITGGFDYTPPLITGANAVSLDSASYDVGAGPTMATVTVAATDTNPISEMCISINKDDLNSNSLFLSCINVTDNNNGTYSASFEFPEYLESSPSNYIISDLSLMDDSGNTAHLYTFNSSDTLYQSYNGPTDVQIPNFNFINSTSDISSPVIHSVSLDAAAHSANTVGTLSLNITDSGSGLGSASSICFVFKTVSALKELNECHMAIDQGMNTYTVEFYVNQYLENDTYYLYEVNVWDQVGNQGTISSTNYSDNGAMYDSTSIPVVKTLVSGASTDYTPPVLTSTAPVFDRSSYTAGSFGWAEFEIIETESGVQSYMSLDFRDDTTNYFYLSGNLSNTSGNTWRLDFQIPSDAVIDNYYLSYISIYDNANNNSYHNSGSSGSSYTPATGWTTPLISIVAP